MEWLDIRAEFERILKTSGIKQAAVSKAGGPPQNTLSRVVHNKNKLGPRIGTVLLVLDALGIPPEDFLRDLRERQAGGQESERPTLPIKLPVRNDPHTPTMREALKAAIEALLVVLKCIENSEAARPRRRAGSKKR